MSTNVSHETIANDPIRDWNLLNEAQAVIPKLTKAQHAALFSLDGGLDKIPFITTPGCRCALQRLGLVVERQYEETLTPLGKKVRDVLRGRAADVR